MSGMAKITLLLLIVLVTMHTFANWNAEAAACAYERCNKDCRRRGYMSGKCINNACKCYPWGK
uniref:AKTx n=1 Tax=Centruroides hentzi TaxID=88313 RepID=A0A2I9LNR3_9SCOR